MPKVLAGPTKPRCRQLRVSETAMGYVSFAAGVLCKRIALRAQYAVQRGNNAVNTSVLGMLAKSVDACDNLFCSTSLRSTLYMGACDSVSCSTSLHSILGMIANGSDMNVIIPPPPHPHPPKPCSCRANWLRNAWKHQSCYERVWNCYYCCCYYYLLYHYYYYYYYY